jgi:S1-C subfamily serine protease
MRALVLAAAGVVIGAALAIPAWSYLSQAAPAPQDSGSGRRTSVASADPWSVSPAPPAPDPPVPAPPPPAPPPRVELPPLEDVVARVVPAVGTIQAGGARGTGFFVRPDTVVTNAHVVDGETSVRLHTGGRTHHARVVAISTSSDLALLRVLDPRPGQPTVSLGTASSARVGQEVVAIGSALGVLSNTVTRGIVSAVRQVGQVRLLQTDAAINPGNSGGPLVDRQGQVIGINSMTVARQVGEGVAFAVAIDHAVQLLAGGSAAGQAHPTETPAPGLESLLRAPSEPEDDRRARGTQALMRALEQAAQRAGELDAYWNRYERSCVASADRGSRPWFGVYETRGVRINATSVYDCAGWLETVGSHAAAIRAATDEAVDRARREGVYPGVIRDLRRKHRLDWE